MRIILSLLLIISSSPVSARNLSEAIEQSAAGMKTQSARMKVIAQNIANSGSTGTTPGAEPYRRKIITLKQKVDPETGNMVVKVDRIGRDYRTPFSAKYDPNHPAADNNGYVLLPNVSSTTEKLDMKESERSYEANLGAIGTSKRMYMNTLDLLR